MTVINKAESTPQGLGVINFESSKPLGKIDFESEVPAFEPKSKEPIQPKSLYEMQMETYKPLLGEVSHFEIEPFISDKAKQDSINVLKGVAKGIGMEAIATSELTLSLASSILLFIPSKMYGIMALPFGREVADIAEEEMAKLGYQPFTDKGREAAEMVGRGFEWFLSPARKVDELVSKLSPELGYLAGFGAELAMFIMTGGLARGAKAKFKPTIKQVEKLITAKKKLESDRMETKEQAVESIPDEALKEAQEKIIEAEKAQIELDDAKVRDTVLKEDLKVKGEKVKEAKVKAEEPKVEIPKFERTKDALDFGEKATPEQVVELKRLREEALAEAKTLDIMSNERGVKDYEAQLYREAFEEAEKKPEVKKPSETEVDWFGEREPTKVTELDRQTGVEVPEIKGERSPFFQNREEADTFRKIYKEYKSALEDPEVYTQKLINDMNNWYHGDNTINVEHTRNELSTLSARADELLTKVDEHGRPYFIKGEDHLLWKETVSDAAEWARELRLEIEQREGPTLYSGLPLDAMGKIIAKAPEKPPDPFPKVKEKAKEIVRERRSKLNLANYETNRFVASIEKKTTPKQREALVFALEKTDVPKEFNRPDLQKVLVKDKKHIETVSKEIKDWFDEGWKKIKYHIPDLSVKQIEDYVTHLWDVPKHKRAEATAWFSTQNRLLERRFIPTYAEGIKRGYMPKTLDILEIIRVHDSICNRAIENTRFVKRLMAMEEDGTPLMQRSAGAPMDWVEVDYPAITRRIPLPEKEVGKKGEFVKEIKVRVHPDLVRPLKTIFEERFDHPIVSAYEAMNGIMKKTNLSASLFHHGALGETGIALIGLPKTLNIYFNPVKIYKGLVRGEFDLFTKEKIAKDSIVNGVQYGATADIPVAKIQGYLNELARISAGTPLANRLTKFLKDFNSVWDKALWSYLHDTLKLYGYESLVSKMDPKLGIKATKMAKREIAQLVNDTFGGQNWDTLMITPKEVQMMTWSLLSADWTFSTTRQALAPTGIGRIYKETAGLRSKMGGRFWLRAALFFGVGMNMLNAMYRSKDMKESPQYYEDKEYSYLDKTMFGNTIGKKTYLFKGRYKDGTERYVRWGKQFRDFFELLITPFRKLGGKMAPVPQLMSEIFTGHSLSGFKNDDIYGTKGLEKTKGIFKTVVKAPLPISVKRFMRENMEFKPLDIMMQSSKGMSRYAAMEYFKKAIIEGNEDLLSDTYIGTLRNNLPAFTLFNAALSWAEAEIMADIAKDIEGIEDTRNKLSLAESAYDKRRYGRILKKLEKERVDKEAGLRLFRVAVEKARSYRELGLDKKGPKFPIMNSRDSQGKSLGEISFE